ncbi:hypothetical protein F5X68DRAFT_197385 [Plectosphaerella plurivora]|uniref:DUF8035 domain-containing protein n=1 Tax=Plectosphaerella plurivora TaxID=936078 RepID=A0A9P8VN27_9PEZI|nr:hypothetical protein F5X68DRAFT_197385 [Plectosphaerella plurivora]
MAYRTNDFEDQFYDERRRPQSTYGEVRIAERERDRQSDRLDFLRSDPRPQEAGPLVLRSREVESREVARPRYRSPSPLPHEHMGMVRRARSLTPPHIHEERERERIRIQRRDRVRYERSPSPVPVQAPVRYERRRSSSDDREREHIRIIQRERERERIPERVPSPRPPSPPPVVKGPTIEREVITHYRGIDHGIIRVPSPQPPPRPVPRPITRTENRELEIDISTSRRDTHLDVRESSSRRREPSMERRSPHLHSTDLVLSTDRDRIRIEDRHYHSSGRRRAQSAAPPMRSPVDEEAEYITSRIDSRGRMGEAWNGATKDWTIVDVPPGTERVRMDGVGGGAAEVTWQRYNGVRRTQFIPERDGAMVPVPAPAPAPRDPRKSGYDRELEIEISRDRHRRHSRPPPPPKRDEMWTEITKDLVCREALMECRYEFEETNEFFYVMKYLKYDNVLELIQITEEIRRERRNRDYWERDHRHYGRPRPKYDERVSEREVIYDNTRMRRV